MIQRIEGINIEIKWRHATCATFHIHNQECGAEEYYWRFADELHSAWRGPCKSRGGAAGAAEEAIQAAT